MANQWFRMYSEAVDDDKLRLLAFEDRWHFVALLCLKAGGILDAEQSASLLRRKVAVKLGVDSATLDEIERRLIEVGLIGAGFQPIKWEKRQYLPNRGMPETENAADRRGYVYFIGEPNSDKVKIGFSKNPWARLKNLQTASHAKLEIVCHTRTANVSEADIHYALREYRVNGEWFARAGAVESAINAIKSGVVKDADELAKEIAKHGRSELATTVATTTDTDTDTDTDKPKKIARARQLPSDFMPNETGARYADERKLNQRDELEAFKNWHTAKGSTFKDWQAAWRTWCDKAVGFGRAKAAGSKAPRLELFENRQYGQGGKL